LRRAVPDSMALSSFDLIYAAAFSFIE